MLVVVFKGFGETRMARPVLRTQAAICDRCPGGIFPMPEYLRQWL